MKYLKITNNNNGVLTPTLTGIDRLGNGSSIQLSYENMRSTKRTREER